MDKGLEGFRITLWNRDRGKDRVSSGKAEYIPLEESSSWHFYVIIKAIFCSLRHLQDHANKRWV